MDTVFKAEFMDISSMHVVVTSLGTEVEEEGHGEGLAELEHSCALVAILHPHHGLTAHVANGIVDAMNVLKEWERLDATITIIQ